MSQEARSAASTDRDPEVVNIDALLVRLEDDGPAFRHIAVRKSELRALLGIAEDALALLDLHISPEQRKELGVRIVGRLA